MGKPHLTSMKFTDLDLHDSLKESLVDNGYEFCTEIQEKALPVLLKGQDVTGQAQTGTGKTATFLLATLNHLMTVPVEEGKKVLTQLSWHLRVSLLCKFMMMHRCSDAILA